MPLTCRYGMRRMAWTVLISLGVKGSPVQIRPSRLVVEFFRIYFYLTRANKRAIPS